MNRLLFCTRGKVAVKAIRYRSQGARFMQIDAVGDAAASRQPERFHITFVGFLFLQESLLAYSVKSLTQIRQGRRCSHDV